MALPASRHVPLVDRLVGAAGFAAAAILLRLPFATLLRLVTTIKRLCCRRDATPAEAENAVLAAQMAGRWFPGRAACLEHSLAAVLSAAARGRAVDWCIGGRLAPYASHAWIQAEGRPVGEPAGPDRPYLPLLTL
jgi:hypothetical protein